MRPAWRLLVHTGVAALVLAAPYASGDTRDTFFITANVSQQHDDNLFRLPSDIDVKPLIGRSSASEDITTTSVMLNINKDYSLQRFELQAGFNDYRYRNFSYLDYTALPYKALWRWSVTPSVHGNLLTERTQTTSSFTDYNGYDKRNTATVENSRFDAELDVSASWHLLGGVYRRSSENSEQTRGEGDSITDSAEVGLSYSFPSGSSVRYILRSADGEYINRRDPIQFGLTDNGFTDREHALSVNWKVSGKTDIDARLAHFERTHDHFAVRDYDGTTGSVNLNWSVTGKSYLRVGLSRQLAGNQSFYSSYTRTNRLSVTPHWQISSKTALRLQYDLAHSDYLGAIAQTAQNGRCDTLRSALLAFDWTPMRDLTLSASVRKDTRDSNKAGLDYESKVFMFSANLGW